MVTRQSANIRSVLTRRCAAMGIPCSGTFELTPRCNLRCKMCYVRLTPEEMKPIGRELTADEWLELGRQARDAGMVFLLLTGGEPTIRPDFPEIYEGLTQMGLSVSVNTNGSLLTPAIREVWKKSPPSSVNITLYGTCREDYGALCGNSQVYDEVVENLVWLQSQHILVHLNTTMVPANEEKWKEIEAFAKSRDLELRMTTYCFPPLRRGGCGACQEFSRLAPERAAELTLQDLLYREGYAALVHRYEELGNPPPLDCHLETGTPIQCMAGRSMFWIDWTGALTPCGMLPTPAAQPMREGFAAAWDSIHRQTAEIRLCPDCLSCPDRRTCFNCAAVVYTETGSYTGRPEYMCRYSRAYRTKLEQMLAELPASE